MRKIARRYALQVLYALDLNPDAEPVLGSTITEKAEGADLDFAETLIRTVREHREEIDQLITSHLRKWSLSQLNAVDRNILRIGMAELFFPLEGAPEKRIIIDEAVDMAKVFGGETSYRFINAILDTAAKEKNL